MDEKMMAYVLHDIGDLRYEETVRPCPHTGEVMLRVKAAGICGSDIPRIYQTGAYHHPLIPGHEFSGQVVELGEGVDRRWEGQRVGVFPLIPCGKCLCCKKKQYEMCSQYDYLGSRRDGGFAEYVRVPEWNLIELPNQVTFEQAAMLEPMAVAIHAIRQSGLLIEHQEHSEDEFYKKTVDLDKDIAVCGLGTIGLLVCMFLKCMGYRNVYAIGNKDFQCTMSEKFGIMRSQFCNNDKEDCVQWLRERTRGEGIEFFFECAGKNEVLVQGLSCIAPGGLLLLLGNPSTEMSVEKSMYWKILRKQITIQGTWNSSFVHEEKDDWHYVLRCLRENRIFPEHMITQRFCMEELEKGFELMHDRAKEHVKVIGLF